MLILNIYVEIWDLLNVRTIKHNYPKWHRNINLVHFWSIYLRIIQNCLKRCLRRHVGRFPPETLQSMLLSSKSCNRKPPSPIWNSKISRALTFMREQTAFWQRFFNSDRVLIENQWMFSKIDFCYIYTLQFSKLWRFWFLLEWRVFFQTWTKMNFLFKTSFFPVIILFSQNFGCIQCLKNHFPRTNLS